MSQHSIIFCGTPDFAVPSLEELVKNPVFTVTLVITQPDKPVGRKQVITPPPVKVFAEKHGISMFQPENINTELPEYLEKNNIERPDFLVVVAYGKILKKNILDLPTIAPINVHGSLLPRWRGASPVEHAILAGDTESGISIQIMAEELDAGPILAESKVEIEERWTAPIMREKLSKMAAYLLVDTLRKPLKPVPQPTEGITVCKKLSREDGKVDPCSVSAVEIDRKVRALVPWPGVTMMINGQELKVLETSLTPHPDAAILTCSGDTIYLVKVQVPGGKPITGREWQQNKSVSSRA